MAMPYRTFGGVQRAVRLTDIPISIRRRYGFHLIEKAKEDGDILAAVELTAAVERPSERVYWIPAEAVRKVLG